jgi:hypothetical protein
MAVPLFDLAAHYEPLHTDIMVPLSRCFTLKPSFLVHRRTSLRSEWLLIVRHGRRSQGAMCGHSEGEKVPWVPASSGA